MRSKIRGGNPGLTTAEVRIIAALANGFSKDYVRELYSIAPSTLETHLHNIYQKTHANTLAQAVAWYWKFKERIEDLYA